MHKLYRSETDRVIAGVCAGLGEYFEVDPLLVRIIFIVFTLAGGSGVLLYVLLWVLIPSKSHSTQGIEEQVKQNAQEIGDKVSQVSKSMGDRNTRVVMGAFVAFVGIFLILANLGILSWFRFELIWPILLVLAGIYLILKQK